MWKTPEVMFVLLSVDLVLFSSLTPRSALAKGGTKADAQT